MVTLSSPTSTVPSREEGIVGLDVSISSSFEETTRPDADTVTIANDISGTWDLLKQLASAPKNTFEMASFPSTLRGQVSEFLSDTMILIKHGWNFKSFGTKEFQRTCEAACLFKKPVKQLTLKRNLGCRLTKVFW